MTQDERLEAAIETWRQKLIAAPTAAKRRDAWYTMKLLIGARSFPQIQRMERQMGLSK